MKQVLLSLAVAVFCITAGMAQVTKPTVEGITNFAQVESTVACTGAIKPTSIAGIKKMGFASIINLRVATEPGSEIDAEAAAAREAGITFVHLPFAGAAPDPAVAEHFLQIIRTAGNQPAFIHCATGGRAATMWLIKRVLIDKWELDRATDEAAQLGLASPGLKKFALDYIEAHKK